jgi:hypothetical protein
MGIFSLLGHFLGIEVDISFVVALLTILGYSVNDTIVVFDRIREKVLLKGIKDFAQTVNLAVNETIGRSVNTSLTVQLTLIALYFFGGETTRSFFTGTDYRSILWNLFINFYCKFSSGILGRMEKNKKIILSLLSFKKKNLIRGFSFFVRYVILCIYFIALFYDRWFCTTSCFISGHVTLYFGICCGLYQWYSWLVVDRIWSHFYLYDYLQDCTRCRWTLKHYGLCNNFGYNQCFFSSNSI